MKIDRLLGIITILLNNEKVTAKILAEKFEVSVRTIYRDIENICMAGIPIVTYQGGGGGISIAEGYKLDKSILTSDELGNIIIGLKSIESISNNSNINLLLNKLSPKHEDIISFSDNIFIDLTSFYKTSLSQKISLIREAANSNYEVVFDYFSTAGVSNRYVEPYFITFKWAAWYVFGYCKSREDFRLFKLNRVNRLKITNRKFSRREVPKERLDIDRYFERDKKTITMLIDPSMEYKIVDTYGVDSYEITDDNRIKFQLIYVNHQYAMDFIRSLGDKVCVLSPQSIIDEIKANALNILNMY
ncbi:helix-turn-helix transcriptional regulator [Alkaliphilus peptidifermentans]|uniref:Predicted DNA-binding transcriptional regulator YafY, contains an HTH and WYL domains n=1 Tax=Alkaliphilus peptidifermentans DSM 18978 TaxID=1120976 RepID=A0A1G5BN39_9FIRM|nr:YafY family protein [Alkaliphilus peptidifermentans]SCX91633.1 Predicted DNA-binding transcriptional regulator YafY, contains an HTH and WYL domains [Alkaliphilus peptidifermentans DSM 18978]